MPDHSSHHHKAARSNRRTPSWPKYAGLALLALIAAVLVYFAVSPEKLPFATTGSNLSADSTSVPASVSATPSPEPTRTAAPNPTEGEALPLAVFIGDADAAGIGAESAADRWTSVVAGEMGWEELNLAIEGSAYFAFADESDCASAGCENFQSVADGLTSTNADVIVVSGGQADLADWSDNKSDARQGVKSTLKRLRKDHPDAQIIVLGPTDGAEVGARLKALDKAVRVAAKDVDATYISLIKPRVLTSKMVTDETGPANSAGQAAIAARVLESIEN